MDKINQELERCIDRHSKKIVSKYIELLLDYCVRFYERQFITRNEANKTIIKQFDKIINNHFETKQVPTVDILSHKYCANLLHLSPEYFNDLLTVSYTHLYLLVNRNLCLSSLLVDRALPVDEDGNGEQYQRCDADE